ncbi:hypothetical protein AX16_001457 [Volvariella volvacea WC 439]|nr:hypothetical protein AX16_001457 [Volvariella volvacea WC 439]
MTLATNLSVPCPKWLNETQSCLFPNVPFYYSYKPTLIEGLSDQHLTLAVPVLAYWSLSLLFHYLDTSGWKWLEKYRIHESAEVQKKNLASRTQVVVAVIFQQIIQTAMGLWWLQEPTGPPANHQAIVDGYKTVIQGWVHWFGGPQLAGEHLGRLAYMVYWWAIPALQFLFGIVIIDTWQYFLHRGMHMNKFLYRHFHSWHHRLYVPYAFGALYNHPVEGFLLDTMGGALAEWIPGLSARQAMLIYLISTFKTVDDHCGYRLPFDPLQMITSNNADYHDIHHQVVGIKSNFSQPFFIHWDVILGTRLTRQEIEQRRRKPKAE